MSDTSSSRPADGGDRPGRRWFLRLRPRLIATLALVAALTAIAVAGASYVAVRQVRLSGATDEAVDQSRFNLTFAADRLPPDATSSEVESLLAALQRRGGFDTVVISGGRTYQTSVSVGPAALPGDLREIVERGRIASARRTIAGQSHVVVGGVIQPGGHELWFFFPLGDVFDDLRTLGQVLVGSALIMVVLSGAVAVAGSRALLRPIARARDAAHRLEAGELATRLTERGTDEFAELSHSFNAMAAALERTVGELRDAEAEHRRFVADVSHELRTPVTALAAAADVLAPRVPAMAEEHRRAARLLVEESHRLRVLVEDLMEISRLDAGKAVVELDRVDLRRLLFGMIEDRDWGGTVRADEVERVVVQADPRRLDRVLANLIDNAVRHGDPPVELTVTPSGRDVVIEVRDHGPGIPAEHLPHLFDRFYKADSARRRSSSSGLGLAIARENVALHGGTVAASNHPGGGARFTVMIPGIVTEPLLGGEAAVTNAIEDRTITPVTEEGP